MIKEIKLRQSLAECKNDDEIEKYVVKNDGLSDSDWEHVITKMKKRHSEHCCWSKNGKK